MNDTLFQKAVGLARAGRLDDARGLFVELIEQDPRSEAAWLWYSDTLGSIDERIEALKQCLVMIPGSAAAREGLDQLNRGRGDPLVLKLITPPLAARPGSPFLADDPDEAGSYTNLFQSGEPDSGIGAIFTVPPEELTEDEIAEAEKKLSLDARLNLYDQAKEEIASFPFRRKNSEQGAQGTSSPVGAFAQLEAEVKKEMAAARQAAPANPPGWSLQFSDESPRANEPKAALHKEDAGVGLAAAAPPPGPQAKSQKKSKATPQDWIFYLVVGIVICVILLVVIFISMALPS